MLGRSQPAISMQMKQLEEMVKVQLLIRSCAIKLTEERQMFCNYARQIIKLNNTAVSRLTVPSVSVSVTLSKFSQAYPDVTLDVQTDLSVNLLQDF